MNDKMKTAFDEVRADEQLKRNTLVFLQGNIRQKSQRNHSLKGRRMAVSIACFLILTFAGLFSYNSYFTEVIYVDVDINPSIELTINPFDRIIGVYAYNGEGEELLAQLDLMHKSYENALTMLTELAIQKGFLLNDGLISVTLQSDKSANEDAILKTLQTNILSTARQHHALVQVDVFSVDSDTREHAHQYNLSPAKYLAAQDLQEVDPTVTFEGCRNHSIKEIQTLTKEHGGRHHGPRHQGSGHHGQ